MTIVDPSALLQARVVNLLKQAGTVAGDRIFSPVPSNPKFPYVSVGNIQIISEKVECLEGAEIFLTLDGWSRENSKLEIHQLGAQITAALDDADLSDGQVTVNSCLLESTVYLDDPDGKTRHAVLTFHILTD
ncbi:DUF3168 domain-containing protein [Bradyrhizobium lablabi]|uniref:DUF3168 domain-containing protein n=1 Tax=Bradyrhizobium lablabi TaxID=722472 RepID=UPI001BA67EEF|nr:DUF3168 domain-containing protein [Bradyrhizobium lablabi]MBR0695950.1 DUF3168 domain-containing protein [Bradyrhizobium lablabi]